MHRLLRDRNRHLSAEELLSEASERLPGVSLPTVYATLELFEQLGIVRRVNGGGGTLLWDTRADAHHHMICRRCGRIEDLETPLDLGGPGAPPRAPAFSPTGRRSSSAGSAPSCRTPLTRLRVVRLEDRDGRSLRVDQDREAADGTSIGPKPSLPLRPLRLARWPRPRSRR